MNGLRPKSSLNKIASVPSQSSSQSKSPRHCGSSVQGLVKCTSPEIVFKYSSIGPITIFITIKIPFTITRIPLPITPGEGKYLPEMDWDAKGSYLSGYESHHHQYHLDRNEHTSTISAVLLWAVTLTSATPGEACKRAVGI